MARSGTWLWAVRSEAAAASLSLLAVLALMGYGDDHADAPTNLHLPTGRALGDNTRCPPEGGRFPAAAPERVVLALGFAAGSFLAQGRRLPTRSTGSTLALPLVLAEVGSAYSQVPGLGLCALDGACHLVGRESP